MATGNSERVSDQTPRLTTTGLVNPEPKSPFKNKAISRRAVLKGLLVSAGAAGIALVSPRGARAEDALVESGSDDTHPTPVELRAAEELKASAKALEADPSQNPFSLRFKLEFGPSATIPQPELVAIIQRVGMIPVWGRSPTDPTFVAERPIGRKYFTDTLGAGRRFGLPKGVYDLLVKMDETIKIPGGKINNSTRTGLGVVATNDPKFAARAEEIGPFIPFHVIDSYDPRHPDIFWSGFYTNVSAIRDDRGVPPNSTIAISSLYYKASILAYNLDLADQMAANGSSSKEIRDYIVDGPVPVDAAMEIMDPFVDWYLKQQPNLEQLGIADHRVMDIFARVWQQSKDSSIQLNRPGLDIRKELIYRQFYSSRNPYK